ARAGAGRREGQPGGPRPVPAGRRAGTGGRAHRTGAGPAPSAEGTDVGAARPAPQGRRSVTEAWDPGSPSTLQVQTLADGAQPAAHVAERVAQVLARAQR